MFNYMHWWGWPYGEQDSKEAKPIFSTVKKTATNGSSYRFKYEWPMFCLGNSSPGACCIVWDCARPLYVECMSRGSSISASPAQDRRAKESQKSSGFQYVVGELNISRGPVVGMAPSRNKAPAPQSWWVEPKRTGYVTVWTNSPAAFEILWIPYLVEEHLR